MDYVTLHKVETFGGGGSFGLEIKVAAPKLPDLGRNEIRQAAYAASDSIIAAVRKEIKAADPKTVAQTEDNRRLVDEVFPAKIFVDEIPNQYCGDWCCAHLPWFIVTTEIGRFTIGRRKRVISIDWGDTLVSKGSHVLFPDEDVTKGDTYIHAWEVDAAKRYIAVLLDSATP
jgi:hypothetical protein